VIERQIDWPVRDDQQPLCVPSGGFVDVPRSAQGKPDDADDADDAAEEENDDDDDEDVESVDERADPEAAPMGNQPDPSR
jgi:hypothetical protein